MRSSHAIHVSRKKTKSNSTTGILLIIAAVAFWVSWVLMPDQGTADTMHILKIVREQRDLVWASVLVQIFSSLFYLPALFYLVKDIRSANTLIVWGAILLSVGAMGMCADAFFHLLAFYMTSPEILLEENVITVMELMQTKGILLLIPLLLPFFFGSLLLAIGLFNQGIDCKPAIIIFLTAFVIAFVGPLMVNLVLGYGRSFLVLMVLGLFALGQINIGYALNYHARHKLDL